MYNFNMLESIVALATPPLKSALAVIRVSGENSFENVSKIFSKEIIFDGKNKIFVGDIKDNNDEIIDEVVLLAYRGPYSFTGEDSVEIICHGSMIIVNQIVSLCIKNGCRYALNGEFSNRAFLNNKLGLIEAEAINDVINATSAEAKKLALLSLKGKTSKLILPIKSKLADILSLIEVNIDYPEYYDIEQITLNKIIVELKEISDQLDNMVENGIKGNIIKDGINIAIVGKPNAGKSSLLNAFLDEDKAIVTSIPGTTRDVVEGSINIKGVTIFFKDTAGIRESEDVIEKEGINKSKQAILDSDLIIYVVDSTDECEDQNILDFIKDKNYIKVFNKNDIKETKNGLSISAINKNIEVLKKEIYKKLNLNENNYTNPSINNMRDLGILKKVKDNFDEAIELAKNNCSLDIISVPLNNSYRLILELIGENNDSDIIDEIFSRFCLGK